MRALGYILIGFAALLLMPAAPFAAEPVPDHAVILMYHHFGDDRHPSTNIRLEQFETHLDHLEQSGYQVWPLEKLVHRLTGGLPVPDRVVAITVDDAYTSVYTEAYPRLRARGWPFTVFVATDGVDRRFNAYLNWDQMREMAANGVTFANHSASHDHLPDRREGETRVDWAHRVRGDIDRAQRRLTEELGRAPMLLAYPYGEYSRDLLNLVTDMGFTGFGQHSGPVGRHSDSATLPRFPMSEEYGGIGDFRTKVATLPFPIADVSPRDPVVAGDTPPVLTVTLGPGDARLDQLACFASGMGGATVTWLDDAERRFSVVAAKPPQTRRSRYNCTAPSTRPGRYYWYSHPWLLPTEPAD